MRNVKITCLLILISIFAGSKLINAQSCQLPVKKTDSAQVQREQLIWPTVMLKAPDESFGSGTIIHKRCDENDGNKYKYYILTAHHTIKDRFIQQVYSRDFITGANKTRKVEGNFEITIFKYDGKLDKKVLGKFEDEISGVGIDAGLISFISEEDLPNIANIATDEMLNSLTNLVEVYASSCPLKQHPMLTTGLISLINDDVGGRISATGNAALGSSGGGLYIKVDDKYYLIGLIVEIAKTTDSRYLFSYITNSTSIKSIRTFLTKNGI